MLRTLRRYRSNERTYPPLLALRFFLARECEIKPVANSSYRNDTLRKRLIAAFARIRVTILIGRFLP